MPRAGAGRGGSCWEPSRWGRAALALAAGQVPAALEAVCCLLGQGARRAAALEPFVSPGCSSALALAAQAVPLSSLLGGFVKRGFHRAGSERSREPCGSRWFQPMAVTHRPRPGFACRARFQSCCFPENLPGDAHAEVVHSFPSSGPVASRGKLLWQVVRDPSASKHCPSDAVRWKDSSSVYMCERLGAESWRAWEV